ncbi:hypothetical protein OAF65_02270 [Verrucomicrobiales bacterium]|nr:hypothetical protein [Verrucomicrobiales bacterium]
MKIHKVNPVGWANVSALATAIMYFILMLLGMVLGGVLGGMLGAGGSELGGIMGGGITMLIFGPPIMGIVTWIFTAIFALIFNLALKWSGGLQIDTSE